MWWWLGGKQVRMMGVDGAIVVGQVSGGGMGQKGSSKRVREDRLMIYPMRSFGVTRLRRMLGSCLA
jgi:hypothetical protein